MEEHNIWNNPMDILAGWCESRYQCSEMNIIDVPLASAITTNGGAQMNICHFFHDFQSGFISLISLQVMGNCRFSVKN